MKEQFLSLSFAGFDLPVSGSGSRFVFRTSREVFGHEHLRQESTQKTALRPAGFFLEVFSPKNVKKLKTYCTTRYLFKPLRLNSFKELLETENDQAHHT